MNQDLWNAIYELTVLLQDNVQTEEAYQRYFERNPVVFRVLGFHSSASFEKKSGNKLPFDVENERQLEPDFICGDPYSQKVTVFELKTPVDSGATVALSNGNRVKFKAVLESHISQVAEYCEFIAGNSNARSVISDKLNMCGVSTVEGLLVYGLSSGVQTPEIAKLAARRSPPLRILSFDEVLSELLRSYSIGRNETKLPDANGEVEEVEGATFVAHLVICEQQRSGRAYLFDIGREADNRLSIYIENGRGVVEIIDNKGEHSFSHWTPVYNSPFYLRVSISGDGSLTRSISVFVNNNEVDFRQSLGGDEFKIDMQNAFLIGANQNGRSGARFRLLAFYVVASVLNWHDRVNTFRYFLKETGSATRCLEFDGEAYMYVANKGRPKMTENSDKRPRVRGDFTDVVWGFEK